MLRDDNLGATFVENCDDLDAIRMKSAGKTPSEIHRHIRGGVLQLGLYAEHGDESNFEIRFVETGEVIRFDGKDYSYSRQWWRAPVLALINGG